MALTRLQRVTPGANSAGQQTLHLKSAEHYEPTEHALAPSVTSHFANDKKRREFSNSVVIHKRLGGDFGRGSRPGRLYADDGPGQPR